MKIAVLLTVLYSVSRGSPPHFVSRSLRGGELSLAVSAGFE